MRRERERESEGERERERGGGCKANRKSNQKERSGSESTRKTRLGQRETAIAADDYESNMGTDRLTSLLWVRI